MTDVLTAFTDGQRAAGTGWTARCPAHEDARNSLSIGRGDDGRWLLKCHTGCALEAILSAAHLELADLFPSKTSTGNGRSIVTVFDYRDEHGVLLYQVCRCEPKYFLQRAADGTYSIKGVRRVPYTNVDVMGPNGKRSHVERQINPEEAAVVRQIFAWSAGGDGFSRIAKRFNAEHARCPHPMSGPPAGWAPTSVHAILLRPTYRGELVYNATRKRDQWGQRKTSDRPESEWIRVAAPQLRIVSDEVWHAAHARLKGIRAQLGTFGHARRA